MSPYPDNLDKAAELGVPSIVWRAGQDRRLKMIREWSGERLNGLILENGSGLGQYLKRLAETAQLAVGIEPDFERTKESLEISPNIICGVGETQPFPENTFDMILSHEVIEHVTDDLETVQEMVRVLKPGGRLILFCPNRGYPFEQHGFYWRGKYHFGNIPLINYLPMSLRNKLAPHVKVYTKRSLEKLFNGLSVRFVHRTVIFGAYDNIIARFGALGRLLRWILQTLEKTPLRAFGLSHFWVVEKTSLK